jgi:hypothetical protein
MSFEPPPSVFSQATRTSPIDADKKVTGNFILLRHDILESFATLEQSIRLAVEQTGVAPASEGAALGQQLEALSKLKPSSSLSKSRCASIKKIIEQAKLLIPVRNDIVHSHQHIANIGEFVAIYRNSSRSKHCYPLARVLTAAQHEALRAAAIQLAEALINPPSQPQPLPGATTGP